MEKIIRDHQPIIDALRRVRCSDELHILAVKISRTEFVTGHLDIADELEKARKRLVTQELLPIDACNRALDTLSAQWEASRQ
jgi:uncharacterized protein (DUF2336 family)